jgi:hypothetical protein
MKGKIIVIDNGLQHQRKLIVKQNYILAHTCNVEIKPFSPALQRRENPNNAVENRLDFGL